MKREQGQNWEVNNAKMQKLKEILKKINIKYCTLCIGQQKRRD